MLIEQQASRARALPLVIAHRGASAHAPENTLVAFDLACRSGAAMLETDARVTRDGAVVLLHDASLARTTDRDGLVEEMALAEVQTADAGYRFHAADGSHPWRARGVCVPTLEETLRWLTEAWPTVRLNVEIKHAVGEPIAPLVDAVARAVRSADAGARVLLSSFSRDVLLHVRATQPDLAAALICDAGADLGECIAWSAAQGLVAVHPHQALLPGGDTAGTTQRTAGGLRAAQQAGLAVHVWTVNDPARMRGLAGAGVSGIISDDPDLLRRTLAG